MDQPATVLHVNPPDPPNGYPYTRRPRKDATRLTYRLPPAIPGGPREHLRIELDPGADAAVDECTWGAPTGAWAGSRDDVVDLIIDDLTLEVGIDTLDALAVICADAAARRRAELTADIDERIETLAAREARRPSPTGPEMLDDLHRERLAVTR